MAVEFLLDEHVEPRVGHRLAAYGYDVVTVGSADGPGSGVDDETVAGYSGRTERVLVTYDDDFVTDLTADDFHCVVYFDDTTLPADDVADVLHEMASSYPESEFRGVQYGSSDWL